MKNVKTLGPASAELLLRLSAGGKTIFSIADAQAITDKTYKATAALLGKLVRKRWLVRFAGQVPDRAPGSRAGKHPYGRPARDCPRGAGSSFLLHLPL
ncbi:MAG: hypothetical protein SXV54_13830 [Chloroflexota bacterium]|nr:hypothetical protein [Chloroflexota bacterium]